MILSMKPLIISALLLFSAPVFAQSVTNMSTSQLAMEGLFDATLVVDYQQTRHIDGFCVGRINCTIHETNPILGDRPSDAHVRNYFTSAVAAHYAVSNVLAGNAKVENIWQASGIAMELLVIAKNKRLGLSWNF
jgi:hypothetical protein